MLLQLSISNYAIIDQLDLFPDAGLNIVTGETGAGKSIILGALDLILGGRADTSVLINKEKKCVVEATFDVKGNEALHAALQNAELDEDSARCVIRREISAAGKSRAFVNDTPVTLTTLNELTGLLVDLHRQFDNHAVENESFQIMVLDATAGNQALKAAFRKAYEEHKQTQAELEKKKRSEADRKKDADYKQFLFDELEQAQLQPDEIENAEARLKTLSSAEKITAALQQVYFTLSESETALVNELRKQAQLLQGVTEYLPESASLAERMNGLYAEAKDIADEVEALQSKVRLDPEELHNLQERFDLGVKLQKKHGVASTEALLQIYDTLARELSETENLGEEIERLTASVHQLEQTMRNAGEALSAQRQAVAPGLSERVTELLKDVGMPNAVFRVDIKPRTQPSAEGYDAVSFLLDANKSGAFQSVEKAASGGELSRIALCVKSLIARVSNLPTLIFDEVDTGISGEAARKVGLLLRELAGGHQIICITHQPQVAAKGNNHFFVYKEEDADGKIKTRVRILDDAEKVPAIARMIGGEDPGETALAHARDLFAR